LVITLYRNRRELPNLEPRNILLLARTVNVVGITKMRG